MDENSQPLIDQVRDIGPGRLGFVGCSEPATNLATRSLGWIARIACGLGMRDVALKAAVIAIVEPSGEMAASPVVVTPRGSRTVR